MDEEQEFKNSRLFEAVLVRDEDAARSLLAMGAQHFACNFQGCTPLHIAAANRDFRTCEVLVRAGADSTVPDMNGFTPADFAQEPDLIHLSATRIIEGASAMTSPQRRMSFLFSPVPEP